MSNQFGERSHSYNVVHLSSGGPEAEEPKVNYAELAIAGLTSAVQESAPTEPSRPRELPDKQREFYRNLLQAQGGDPNRLDLLRGK